MRTNAPTRRAIEGRRGQPPSWLSQPVHRQCAASGRTRIAKAMNSTLALVELGFYEGSQAAVSGELSRLPAPTPLEPLMARTAGLGSPAQVVATTFLIRFDTGVLQLPDGAAGHHPRLTPL